MVADRRCNAHYLHDDVRPTRWAFFCFSFLCLLSNLLFSSILSDRQSFYGEIIEVPALITTNAVNVLNRSDWMEGLTRHINCDWGVICQEDWNLNDWSLANDERIFSAYDGTDGEKFWIITERDRRYREC